METKIIFEGPKDTDRGYTIRALDIGEKADYFIEVMKDGSVVRSFMFPAYKVYNLQAHFSDIVDSEIEKNAHGYNMASSTGFDGTFVVFNDKESRELLGIKEASE